MRDKFGVVALISAFVLTSTACSQRLPLEEAGMAADVENLSEFSMPLDLSQFEVVSTGGGYRGVFLHLSRYPDAISYSHQSDPARITVVLRGPTGAETEEETFPGGDSLVSLVRVNRGLGQLNVTLDLAMDDPPDYSVHRMADWVMVRISNR